MPAGDAEPGNQPTGALPLPPIPRAALVTGGAQRIGRALSLALAEDGFAVAVHYHRSRDAAENLAELIRGKGGAAVALAADLEFEEAARLRDEIRRLEQSDLGLAVAPTNGAAAGSRPAEGQRGRSIAGRAGVSARDVVRAKMRARKERRARR